MFNFTAFLGSILCSIINLYLIIILVRIIISWLVLPPSKFTYYLNLITDPVLNYAKKNFPIRIGIIDLSIIVPIIFLTLLSYIVNDLMVIGRAFSVLYLLEIIIIAINLLLNFAFFVLIINALVLLVINILNIYTYNPLITAFRSIIDPITLFLRRIFKINSKNADRIYLIILVVLIIILFILIQAILNGLLFQIRHLEPVQNKIIPLE